MHEHDVSGRPARSGESTSRSTPRRRGSGPRPVRPGVVEVAVRPGEAERPVIPSSRRVAGWPRGPRLLVRRPSPVGWVPRVQWASGPGWVRWTAVPARTARIRRAAAGLAVAVAATVVVAGMGFAADAVAAVRAAEAGTTAAPVVVHSADATGLVAVRMAADGTAWDVARAVAPGASGPELAALVERIVTDNSLGSVRLHTGQVLRVTVG